MRKFDVDLENVFACVSILLQVCSLHILSAACSSFASPFVGSVVSPFTMVVVICLEGSISFLLRVELSDAAMLQWKSLERLANCPGRARELYIPSFVSASLLLSNISEVFYECRKLYGG